MCFVRWRHLWEEDLKYEAVTSLGRKERSKSQGLGIHTRLGFLNRVNHGIGFLKPLLSSLPLLG